MNIKITGSGSYIPTKRVTNIDFSKHSFLNEDGSTFAYTNDVVAEKFLEITGIQERRYVTDDLQTSDIAFIAAKKAIEDANFDRERQQVIAEKINENISNTMLVDINLIKDGKYIDESAIEINEDIIQ